MEQGHYIPALSAEILRQNQDHGKPTVPLKSILIGNGYVSPLDTAYGYYETLCTTKPGVDEPVFNHTRCQIIAESLPRCLYVYEACYRYPDEILCRTTDQACGVIGALFHSESHAGGRDPFDSMIAIYLGVDIHQANSLSVTRVCEIEHLCYAATLDIQRYINEPATRRALQVPEGVNFSIEAKPVASAFESGNDLYTSVVDEIQFTLENGADVLIYNGNLDLACNAAGNLRWTSSLRWNGQAEFTSQDLKPWFTAIDNGLQQAGSYKEVFARTRDSANRRFAFATVDRAGHMVGLSRIPGNESGLRKNPLYVHTDQVRSLLTSRPWPSISMSDGCFGMRLPDACMSLRLRTEDKRRPIRTSLSVRRRTTFRGCNLPE